MMDITFSPEAQEDYEKHRIVYVVSESKNDIYVLALRCHYNKKYCLSP